MVLSHYKCGIGIATLILALAWRTVFAWDPGVDNFDIEFKAARCVLTAQVVSDVVSEVTPTQTMALAKLRTTGCLIGEKCKKDVVINVKHVARYADPEVPAYAISFPVGRHVILATREECDASIAFGHHVTHPHDHLWSCQNDFKPKDAEFFNLYCHDLTSGMSLEAKSIEALRSRLNNFSDKK